MTPSFERGYMSGWSVFVEGGNPAIDLVLLKPQESMHFIVRDDPFRGPGVKGGGFDL